MYTVVRPSYTYDHTAPAIFWISSIVSSPVLLILVFGRRYPSVAAVSHMSRAVMLASTFWASTWIRPLLIPLSITIATWVNGCVGSFLQNATSPFCGVMLGGSLTKAFLSVSFNGNCS